MSLEKINSPNGQASFKLAPTLPYGVHKPKDPTKLFFGIGVTYAITIAPNDKFQYFGYPDRLEKQRNMLNEQILLYTKLKIDFLFFSELSEPHEGGKFGLNGPRGHFHGTISFKSIRGLKCWLLTEYYKLLKIGIVDIDTITDHGYWINYCTKQQHIIDLEPLTNHDLQAKL